MDGCGSEGVLEKRKDEELNEWCRGGQGRGVREGAQEDTAKSFSGRW